MPGSQDIHARKAIQLLLEDSGVLLQVIPGRGLRQAVFALGVRTLVRGKQRNDKDISGTGTPELSGAEL